MYWLTLEVIDIHKNILLKWGLTTAVKRFIVQTPGWKGFPGTNALNGERDI